MINGMGTEVGIIASRRENKLVTLTHLKILTLVFRDV